MVSRFAHMRSHELNSGDMFQDCMRYVRLCMLHASTTSIVIWKLFGGCVGLIMHGTASKCKSGCWPYWANILFFNMFGVLHHPAQNVCRCSCFCCCRTSDGKSSFRASCAYFFHGRFFGSRKHLSVGLSLRSREKLATFLRAFSSHNQFMFFAL